MSQVKRKRPNEPPINSVRQVQGRILGNFKKIVESSDNEIEKSESGVEVGEVLVPTVAINVENIEVEIVILLNTGLQKK